MFYNM